MKSLGEETDLERRKEEGRGFDDGAQRDGDSCGGGRASREGGGSAALKGRQPSLEPDVSLEVPKVQIEKVFLDDEGLDMHLLLQTRLADLVRVEAGVHVYFRKVKLDAKVVEAEALHKVRLENLHDILSRALATIDHNPRILESLLKRMKAIVDDIGQTAQQGFGSGSPGTNALDDTTEGVSNATKDVGPAAGPAGGAATEAVQGRGRDAGQQHEAGRRRSRKGETKRGPRRSRSLDDDERGADHQVLHAAWTASDQISLVAGETVQDAGRAAGEAIQQIRQATGEVVQQAGEPAVEASAKATWTPRKASGGSQDA